RVRAMLRRRDLIQQTLLADQQHPATATDVQGIHMEPDSYTVTVDGEQIALTRTEFGLLSLLVNNPGRVFNRSYLLDTVWEENYVDGDRSVDNVILRLRKKLKSAGHSIETVWGVGYRWKRS